MAIYAWNSAPVAIKNLSRSLVVCGREFKFLINFTHKLHQSGINQPIHVNSYPADLFQILERSREIYKVLISEHRALHREIRNAQKTITRKFNINGIIFTIVEVQSSAKKGQSGKLSYHRRGLYKIVKI